MTWIFNLKSPELISIVEHTKAHQDECLQAYSKDKADPSLFLVKDSGCYLMPATKTLLPREEGKPASVVAYAEGARPEDGHIGGDDYAENIPLGWFVSPAAVRSAFIVITVTSTNLSAKYTQ